MQIEEGVLLDRRRQRECNEHDCAERAEEQKAPDRLFGKPLAGLLLEQPAENKPETETKAEEKSDVQEATEPSPSEPVYGIQVLASSKVMSPTDKYFKGHDMGSYKVKNLYKYVICRSSDLSQVKESFSTVKSSYPDCFIVKVENGDVTRVK